MADGAIPRFEFHVPEALEGGVYSNILSVWHTPYEFTFDFAVMTPSQQTEEGAIVPCHVVARVKVPPTLLFDILRALNENMTNYEAVFGEIQRPSATPPEAGPTDEGDHQ
jgi:hypothetical protein